MIVFQLIIDLLRCLHRMFLFMISLSRNYRVGQKTGMFLRSDNSATTNDRKAFNTSKFSEFGLA